jgi:hypothetical protein
MELQPLERGQLGVMLVRSILISLGLLGAAAIPAFATADETGIAPVMILGGLALLLAYPVLVSPIRRYRSWGYALGATNCGLATASGRIWTPWCRSGVSSISMSRKGRSSAHSG